MQAVSTHSHNSAMEQLGKVSWEGAPVVDYAQRTSEGPTFARSVRLEVTL